MLRTESVISKQNELTTRMWGQFLKKTVVESKDPTRASFRKMSRAENQLRSSFA